jgi:hypothetical protein
MPYSYTKMGKKENAFYFEVNLEKPKIDAKECSTVSKGWMSRH